MPEGIQPWARSVTNTVVPSARSATAQFSRGSCRTTNSRSRYIRSMSDSLRVRPLAFVAWRQRCHRQDLDAAPRAPRFVLAGHRLVVATAFGGLPTRFRCTRGGRIEDGFHVGDGGYDLRLLESTWCGPACHRRNLDATPRRLRFVVAGHHGVVTTTTLGGLPTRFRCTLGGRIGDGFHLRDGRYDLRLLDLPRGGGHGSTVIGGLWMPSRLGFLLASRRLGHDRCTLGGRIEGGFHLRDGRYDLRLLRI